MHVDAVIIEAVENTSNIHPGEIVYFVSLKLHINFPPPIEKGVDIYKQVRIKPDSPANFMYERLIGVLGEPNKDYSSWIGQTLKIEVDYIFFVGRMRLQVVNIELPEYMPKPRELKP